MDAQSLFAARVEYISLFSLILLQDSPAFYRIFSKVASPREGEALIIDYIDFLFDNVSDDPPLQLIRTLTSKHLH